MSPAAQHIPGGAPPVATQLSPPVQAAPQAPQLPVDVARLTHVPEQSVSPVGQPQRPMEQTSPPVQASPQTPQFAELVARSVQTPPQFERPDPQQMPAWQVSPVGHASVQLPQWLALL